MKTVSPFAITINRQLGSGGSFIGQQLAKHLGIAYIDREITSEAAKRLMVLESELESREEKILSFWQSFVQYDAYAPSVYAPPKTLMPTNRELFDVEADIIRRIASEKSAVIMGRCGFNILSGHLNRISLCFYGEMGFRVHRVAELYAISEKEAENLILQTDKNRSHFCRTFTGKEWSDLSNYDLSIDTSKLGMDKSIAVIINYLNEL